MIIKELERAQVPDIWQIDRSEVIDGIYYHVDGQLELKPEHYNMTGWPPGEAEHYGAILLDCFDRGGAFLGAFDGKLVGVAVLDSKFIGRHWDQLQLKFLHVSSGYRKRGLGKILFDQVVARASELGAKRLYISANPSENSVNFYQHLGCTVTNELDPELFELEPEDIHLEYLIPQV